MLFIIQQPLAAPVDQIDRYLYTTLDQAQTVTIERTITIPAHTATAYFQAGALSTYREFDQYYPFCKLLTDRVEETSRPIQPASYSIERYQFIEDYILWGQTKPVVIASSGGGDGSGGNMAAFMTVMKFNIGNSTGVLSLSCGSVDLLDDGQHITVSELEQAVGDFLSIH